MLTFNCSFPVVPPKVDYCCKQSTINPRSAVLTTFVCHSVYHEALSAHKSTSTPIWAFVTGERFKRWGLLRLPVICHIILWKNIYLALRQVLYCYGANSQNQNPSTLKTRNTFNATAPAPTNSANMMRATKVDREPPQARNAARIAKRAWRIPLHPLSWKKHTRSKQGNNG